MMIIDPPVGPFSPDTEVRAWIARLESMLVAEENPENRQQIEAALQEAVSWMLND